MKVFLFAWIPIMIRGYCYFTHFYIIGCYTQNNTQVLELLVFPMVGNLALSLSAKAVALGFEFGRGVLCEHEAANMSIGGKELNLMVSLTTSGICFFMRNRTQIFLFLFLLLQLCIFSFDSLKLLNQLTSHAVKIKATTNLAQNLDPIQNFLALKLCNKSWTQWLSSICFKLFEKFLSVLFPFGMCKGLLLLIWSHHINREERITFISLYIKLLWCHEVMFLVAFLKIVEMEKIF